MSLFGKVPAATRETAYCLAGLAAVALFVAGPFLTSSGLGSGEAYNYSLSTADFVTQERAGVHPPLVGQSVFAFNGRIHPLRTAPYMPHLTGLIDLATGRRLDFWTLQNLAISASLAAAVFSMYACLRRSTPATRRTAAILAGLYGLAPGVLAVAYAMDLYMTTMTLPWVPVVLCACLRLYARRGFRDYALLAIALGACWEAHPPVAFWMTLVSGLLQLPLILGGRIRGREWLNLLAGAILCGALAVFDLVSTLTVKSYGDITEISSVQLLLAEVGRVFPDSLLPVSEHANQLGDFQLGYLYWGLLAAAVALGLARKSLLPLLLAGTALVLLVLTTPVPFLTEFIWKHVPVITVMLTNQWPMQRLYLIVTALAVFAFALAFKPRAGPLPKGFRDAALLVVLAAAAWTGYEAARFVIRGFSSRLSDSHSALVHRPENIDLTVTSYAILGAPRTFTSGAMDPSMEFRLLRPFDAQQIDGNWEAAGAQESSGIQGTFASETDSDGAVTYGPRLTLSPGRRYLLTLAFRGAPQAGTIQVIGRTTYVEHPLLPPAGSRGFGMREENRHSLSLWTTAGAPEEVEVRFLGADAAPVPGEFADFTLKEIDASRLPVAVDSFVPLTLRVRSHQACYVETPRLYIDGYVASVNGRDAFVEGSPGGMAMFPVPAGDSGAVLRYVGPPRLRTAYQVTRWAFLASGIFLVLLLVPRMRPLLDRAGNRVDRGVSLALRNAWRIAALAAVLVATAYGIHAWSRSRPQAGPLHLRFTLPRWQTHRQQPLLVTGKRLAGTFVYLIYSDTTHVRVGIDVWGKLGFMSDPIEVDYFAVQDAVISTGALYPEGQPLLRGLSAASLENLRNHVKVELNGRMAVDQAVGDYPSTPTEITVGVNRLGGSNCEPAFSGEILGVERLPLPGRE